MECWQQSALCHAEGPSNFQRIEYPPAENPNDDKEDHRDDIHRHPQLPPRMPKAIVVATELLRMIHSRVETTSAHHKVSNYQSQGDLGYDGLVPNRGDEVDPEKKDG